MAPRQNGPIPEQKTALSKAETAKTK